MYTDSINQFNGMSVVSGLSNVCICSDAIGDPKEIIIPNGFNPLTDNYIAIKAVFLNGHNAVNDSTNLTVKCKYSNGDYVQDGADIAQIPIMANKDGTLINIPIHTMDVSGTTTYKVLQPNTVLEMYYDPNANSGNGAFVVIGNPIVLSANDSNSSYTVYANGSIGDEFVGTIKAYYSSSIPYGWLICDGGNGSGLSTGTETFDTTKYSKLYSFLGTDKVPDLRECVLVGVGTNSTFTITNHDIYTVGEFKDDCTQNITGDVGVISSGYASVANGPFYQAPNRETYSTQGNTGQNGLIKFDISRVARTGATTHGKQVGVNYLIKAL